ncbi:efflux RND transporter periplasmic adaptor subunit [Chelatococcus sp. SYSU_G07232]|uniref:Efflux RND transporter periplasmic adaptor subunit n=1 Tax=Chelatococcus albus TaxID=3047466 RepID=A0ABT7AHE6_9HYPH|nr:efflux RND transporter periplasmic adaptor subunit [Chelatococcus sp. SYSU_G07232]MDJ1158792.1 efflux RND transporter periplasmic adaptor subunit [Chelatococcus sp. SYSU_G07232]
MGAAVSAAITPRLVSGLRTIAAAALLPLVLAACNDSVAEVKPRNERPVLVAAVRYEALTPERSFVATIRPRIESDLGFRVAGKVARRLVQVGDRVEAGQALAVLDETDLRLQAEQAEAERRAATTVLAQATADERRGEELRRRGWSTDAAYDRQKSAAEEARGRLARAEKAAELTRNNLSYATLAADAAGIVTATMIEPGQVVGAGQAAVRVARLGEKEAVVAVPEALVERARSGAASVTLWSKPDKRYAATLRELAPAADPATRTYQARFSIPQADEAVSLGMTATLVLAGSGEERAARLPLSALFNQGAGPALWVVDEKTGALALKPVTVRAYEARDVLVAGGVAEGDLVVTLGVQKLDPADKVRIVQAMAF